MRWRAFFLSASGLLLLSGAVLHARGFGAAGPKIAAGNLSPFLKGAVGSLWFMDSLVQMVLGILVLTAAARPGFAGRGVILLLSAIPFGTALLAVIFLGNFWPVYLMAFIGVLLVVSAISDRQAAQQ